MRKDIISYSVNRVYDKSIYISIQDGEVTVNAPWYYTKNKIQEVIEEKRDWILKKINEYKEENNFNIRPIKIFGIIYELKVCYKNVDKIECNINKTVIEVRLPKRYKKIDSNSMMDILMDKIYNKIAERELEGIMEKTRIMTKLAPEDYEIKVMKNCLAKCTDDKRMIIDPRIIKYEKEVVEYIILHEFCHLKYKTHCKAFYNLLKEFMPNYEQYKIEKFKF